jgi:hypothetical protein
MAEAGSDHASFNWTEVRPGCFEMKLDDIESLHDQVASIFAGVGKEQWCVTLCAKLASTFSRAELIERVTAAWRQVWFIHPEIASTVQNGTDIYGLQ